MAERARARLGEQGRGTILFLDEVHRFSRTQQDALLPHVEEGLFVLIGATTENPFFSLTGPLLSRSRLFRLESLTADEFRALLQRALTDDPRGLGDEHLTIDDDALTHLADRAEGDARHALTSLEVAAALAAESGRDSITLADSEAALAMRALRYGDDEHYDVISAFIKSIRGSDVDAGLYWLARMITAGEDPRLIARRLVILASEDVGMGDPHGLVVADAAARAVEFVGMPEAQLNLAHAAIYLATAPKSNSVITAIGAAMQDVRDRPGGSGPLPSAGRPLPWRGEARARRRVRVPARRARGMGGAAVPARRPRRAVLEAHRTQATTSINGVESGGDRVSGSEWVAVFAAQICLVALVVLVVVIVRLDRAAKDLRKAALDFRAEAEPALAELREVVRTADFELDRVDAHRVRRRARRRPGRRRAPTSPTAPSPTPW